MFVLETKFPNKNIKLFFLSDTKANNFKNLEKLFLIIALFFLQKTIHQLQLFWELTTPICLK